VQGDGDAMTEPTEVKPAAVPARTIRAGKAQDPRFWVEPTVWTERMLAALEQGVKGGKWFSLIDKVHPERTLRAAFSQVAANEGAAGVDHVTIEMFAEHLDEDLKRLSEQLRTGTYRPQAKAMAFAPDGDAKTRCAEWTNCLRTDTHTSLMRI
jgi:RNA-directed DNA polymerase